MLSLFYIYLFLHLAPGEDHAIYVSVLEIDDQQMKVKVFTDNLQDAVRNNAGYLTPSTNGNFHVVNRQAIGAYFRQKIELQINGNAVDFDLEEAILEGDSYWITFTLGTREKWRSFELEATYLMELFPYQTNVVKVIGEKSQFFRLTKFNPSCSFNL